MFLFTKSNSLSNANALKELKKLYDEIFEKENGFINTKSVNPKLLEYLRSRKTIGTWIQWQPEVLLKCLSEKQFLTCEDSEFIFSLLDAIHSLQYEIIYTHMFMWFCSAGTIICIGYLIEYFLKH